MSSATDFSTAVLLAWKGELGFSELLAQTAQLEFDGSLPLAAVLYQTWLSRNQSPYSHVGNFNLGTTLTNLGDLAGAEAAYRRAIALSIEFIHPHLNLGLVHERNGRLDEAILEWKWIDQHSPRDELNKPLVVMALNHIGRVLEVKKQFGDAVSHMTQSLLLDPNQPDVLHHWVFLRQKQCEWPVYQDLPGIAFDFMHQSTSALAMLSVSDDPAAQLAAAKHFVEQKVAPNLVPLARSLNYGHKRIRLAYCSSDFCLHPVSLLTVELFELHDKQNFEIYGFCWSPDDGSMLRQRVIGAMDHFFSIGQMSDENAAQLIRSHEIDILIDLQGQTAGARPDMLGYRPAPIQITYLGLPATTGLPSIDYVIADEFLIPREATPFYSEKPLYMPDVYQVSDRKRIQAPRPTRASCGLPEQGFVFCSFNNSFKYTPDMFATWVSILKRVPSSVLWLLADNQWAEANLRRHAETMGISSSRLIFASRVSPENYLARYLVADLFLDTFPFNAGTTANDCLWMGCPILTLAGHSFASRMAGALLTAAELPEMITHDMKTYEEVAVALASEPARCARLREHLQRVRESGALFDTPLFVRNLEYRFKALVNQLPAVC